MRQYPLFVALLLASILPATTLPTFAQRSDSNRGGERGGDDGGRGFRGGFRGGGFGGRGGGGFRGGGDRGGGFRGGGSRGGGGFPGGGFRGGRDRGGGFGGGFSPADMLRRFDRNRNGTLEPDETQGRAGSILERMTSSVRNIDLTKPVSIDRLSRSIEQARGGGSNASPAAVESLVPGFGLEEELAPPLGFGAEGEVFAVKVTDEDRAEAEERFRRYDRNGDGVLTSDEIRRGRWSDNPLSYDRNHDGKLTLSELAIRYAQQRLREGDREERSSGRNSNGDARNRFNLFASRFGGRGGGTRRGFGRGGFGGRGRGDRGSGDGQEAAEENKEEKEETSNTASARSNLKSYRVKTAVERLPGGLPKWFARDDRNEDGQVAMAEYASAWSRTTIDDFAQFDLDGDRIITPEECLKAVENGAVRGSVSSSSRSPTAVARTSSSTTATSSTSSASPPAKDVDARYLDYSRKQIAKYDKNDDQILTANEWQAMTRNPEKSDANGDGRISAEELISHFKR